MKLLKEWRQRKTEEFRVWIAEYLFKTHIQPIVDFAASDATGARLTALEANERSAELGKLIGYNQWAVIKLEERLDVF